MELGGLPGFGLGGDEWEGAGDDGFDDDDGIDGMEVRVTCFGENYDHHSLASEDAELFWLLTSLLFLTLRTMRTSRRCCSIK